MPAEELHIATRLRTEVVRRDLDRSQSQARVRIAQDDVGIVSPADVAWLPADALYVGLGAESPISQVRMIIEAMVWPAPIG